MAVEEIGSHTFVLREKLKIGRIRKCIIPPPPNLNGKTLNPSTKECGRVFKDALTGVIVN